MKTLTQCRRALQLVASLVTLAAVSTTLSAQSTKPKVPPAGPAKATASGACSYAKTDGWVVRQTQFFDDSKHDWSDDTLRTALLQAAGITGALSMPVNNGVEIDGFNKPLGASAPAMVDQLNKLAATRGSVWPTRSVVGAAGTHAVYLLSQKDTTLARAALHRMMEAGPSESPAIDVAVFEDNLRLLSGRKQLYGTQFHRQPDGKVVLAAMEDSSHADMRREGAGLPPFKLGLCFAQMQK